MPARIIITQAQQHEMTLAYRAGQSVPKIALDYDVDQSVIYQRLKEWKVTRPSNMGFGSDRDLIWRNISGYEGLYQVSNTGIIRSSTRVTHLGQIVTGREMSVVSDDDGYIVGTLSLNGHVRMYKVHRLVAQAFIPNPNNLPEINHRNGIKSDNTISNLEWCSDLDNQLHAIRTGLKTFDSTRGENFYAAK